MNKKKYKKTENQLKMNGSICSIQTDTLLPCDVCKQDIVRTAVKINGVKICHDCLKFFRTQAKLNKRTWMGEIQHQTNYINNIAK